VIAKKELVAAGKRYKDPAGEFEVPAALNRS